jgi:hypothetical protein
VRSNDYVFIELGPVKIVSPILTFDHNQSWRGGTLGSCERMPWNVKMRKSRLLIFGLQRIEMNNGVINLGFFGSAFFLYSVFDLCIIHTYKDAILRFHEPSISELLFSTRDCVYRLSIYQLPEVRSINNSLVFRKHENCTAAQGLVFMMLHGDLTTVIISLGIQLIASILTS